MAAAAMEALRRQLVDGCVSHAKLSLARQAHHLIEAKSKDKETVIEPVVEKAVEEKDSYEETAWGPVWRSPLPYKIAGVTFAWARVAHPLRSDQPKWQDN